MDDKERTGKYAVFTGNVFLFHSFDVGDDIDLERVKSSGVLAQRPLTLSKYFKNYHIPLAVELPRTQASPHCASAKLHNFGVITLRYQVPFSATLEEVRARINSIDAHYHEQSIADAKILFQKIKQDIKQPRFFHLRSSYVLIQVNTDPQKSDVVHFKQEYGNLIASILRFETETLSEYQKNEMLASALGYYRGDLIIIDTEAAFAYDDEYADKLDIFEFANIQHLELQYFDRALDKRLNVFYERKVKALSWKAYLPLIGTVLTEPISELDELQVDVSVITDRLENSITLGGDPYYAELYMLLVEKLDLKSWRESIHNKLAIVHNISSVHINRVDSARGDFLSTIVILLIFLEVLIAIFK
jgi:hypothetical protein